MHCLEAILWMNGPGLCEWFPSKPNSCPWKHPGSVVMDHSDTRSEDGCRDDQGYKKS